MNIPCVYEDSPLFERKIENATSGLQPSCKNILKRIPKTNAIIIADYITSMQTEINRSDRYKKAIIMLLYTFSQIYKDKPLEQITRQDVIAFLDRHRKPEAYINHLLTQIPESFTYTNTRFTAQKSRF